MAAGGPQDELPRWATLVLLPLLNVTAALLVSGLLVWFIGEDPIEAMQILIEGAVGYPEAIGYTVYYATSFVFTGLAVAIAFHAGLFNIGGEGQAYVAGLGVTLVSLALFGWPWWAILPLAIVAGAAFGAAWAFVPGYLQAYRGSHVVVTTIMFNFIASALMVWILVEILIAPGQQSPESRPFSPTSVLPAMHTVLGAVGIKMGSSPLNLSVVVAVLACVAFHVYVWHTRWGYELRAVGHNETAAVYAGISVKKTIVIAMALSGALAGLMPLNEVLGVQHRLLVNFTGGAGFVGIAVALMGRNHALGIVLAALLFGALTQGGSELSFEKPAITREMIVVIQGLIILFSGALENLFRAPLARLLRGA